jgi:transcriptional regulator with XRE-family HTH domain
MALDERDRLSARLRELLVEARLAKGMNQTDLAKALRRTQSFVSNYERGVRKVGVIDLLLISRVLGVEARELLGRVK